MADNEVVLELGKLVRRDGDVIKGAETGGYPINRPADVLHLAVKIGTAFLDRMSGFFPKLKSLMVVQYSFKPPQAKMFFRNDVCHCSSKALVINESSAKFGIVT